ncbi:hypothetical protein MLD38_035766 [Melastoma candidum]|uniref:Uncharacterized protein n=1 Tax=Melastoma candidum TaxID=119954 RepID=A0ACB9LHK9_9MYRT|nr:hypothetical protein MLD38_035766 [Melastoma candidum]
MPAVMTPGGPLDLSTVLFRNRIIFISQPINSQVAQRVISQLVTLATIDEDADILVQQSTFASCCSSKLKAIRELPFCLGQDPLNRRQEVMDLLELRFNSPLRTEHRDGAFLAQNPKQVVNRDSHNSCSHFSGRLSWMG